MEILSVDIASAGYHENRKQIQDIQFSINQGQQVGRLWANSFYSLPVPY